jgi:hypothetical protein
MGSGGVRYVFQEGAVKQAGNCNVVVIMVCTVLCCWVQCEKCYDSGDCMHELVEDGWMDGWMDDWL